MKEFSFDEYIDLKDAKPGAEPKYTLRGVSKVKSDFTTRNLPAFAGVIAGAIGVTGLTLAGLFTGVLLGAIGLAAIAPPFGLPILAAVLLGAAIAATVAFVGVVIFSTLKQVKEQKELDQQAQDIASAMPVIAQAKSNAERDIAKSEQEAKEKRMALEEKQKNISETIGNYKKMFNALLALEDPAEGLKKNLSAWRPIFDNPAENTAEFEKIQSQFFEYVRAYMLVRIRDIYTPDQANGKVADPIAERQLDKQYHAREEQFMAQYRKGDDLLELYNNELKVADEFKKAMPEVLAQVRADIDTARKNNG